MRGVLQLIVSPARYGSDLPSRYAGTLQPRFAAARLMLHPDDAQRAGLQDGDQAVLDTEEGSFRLPLFACADLAVGCALVENGSALAQLLPGTGVRFCGVSREVKHE